MKNSVFSVSVRVLNGVKGILLLLRRELDLPSLNIKMISNDVTRWCAEFRGWRGSRRWSLSGCQRTPAFLYYFINTFPSPASYTLCYLAYTCILYSLACKPEFLWSKPCLHLHLIYFITCLYLQTQLYYTFYTYTLHTNRHCYNPCAVEVL